MNTIHSCCPVVKVETLQLFERVKVGGSSRIIPFERRILWLAESSATMVCRHRGAEIASIATLNDFYGYLTSLEGAVTDVLKCAQWRKIQTGDVLAIEIDVTLSRVPVMEDGSREAIEFARYGRTQYRSVPNRWSDRGWWYTSDKENDQGLLPKLEAVQVETVQAIYSTTRHPINEMPADVSAWIAEQRAAVKESQ